MGPYNLNVCIGCNKPFKILKNHLSKSGLCRSQYDMDKLDQELKIKRRRDDTDRRRGAREDLPEDKKIDNQRKDTSRRRGAREDLPEDKKIDNKRKNTSG